MFRAALLAASLLATTAAVAQSAAVKTTLNVGIAAQDNGRLDPYFTASTFDRIPVAWMFNALVRFYHTELRQDLSPLVYYSAARFPIADVMLAQFFASSSIVETPTAVMDFSHCTVAD